jgi:hypothetical protein
MEGDKAPLERSGFEIRPGVQDARVAVSALPKILPARTTLVPANREITIKDS